MPALPADVLSFVSEPNPAVMATVDPDGRAVTRQVVYLADGPEHIILSIAAGSSRGDRLQHLRADPRMSITVLGRNDWTQAVSIQGTAVEFFEDRGLELIDRMAQHYFGGTYARRDPRTAVKVRVDSWSAELPGHGSGHARVWGVDDSRR